MKIKSLLIAVIFLISTINPVTANIVPLDKILHFNGSAYLSNLFYKSGTSKQNAFLLCMGVGLLKEATDAMGYGTPDIKDLVADAAGCAAGLLTFRLESGYVNLKYCKIGVYKGKLFTNRWSCFMFRLRGLY